MFKEKTNGSGFFKSGSGSAKKTDLSGSGTETLYFLLANFTHLDGFLQGFLCDHRRDGGEEEPHTGESPPVVPYTQAHRYHPHSYNINNCFSNILTTDGADDSNLFFILKKGLTPQ